MTEVVTLHVWLLRLVLFLIDTIENRLLLFYAYLFWLPDELVLAIVDGPEVSLDFFDEVGCDGLELFVLVISIFVLAQDDEIIGEFTERHYFLLLQLGDIAQHLVLLDVEIILLQSLHYVEIAVAAP